jgi:hypothetical protein
MGAQLIVGQVQHARSRPAANAFRYPIFNVRLPLDDLASAGKALALERNGWVSFFAKDHGARDGSSLLQWAQTQLAKAGVVDVARVELVCLPRVLGYVFNPVSFWLCWSETGGLRALIAEVNNTFGERLSYVLTSADGAPHIQNGEILRCQKQLHVSPFNKVEGGYQFRCFVNDARFLVRIDYDDQNFVGIPLLTTHISGKCTPLTKAALRKVLWTMPWLTAQVVAKIHWQALKLIIKRVRFLGYLPSEGKR